MPTEMTPEEEYAFYAKPGSRELRGTPRRLATADVVVCSTLHCVDERLDPDLLGEDPFEVDAQVAHLFKHPHLGLGDVYDVWASDPLFYPAKPPGHWLMVSELAGVVIVVPIAPSHDGDPRRCRPIGCYQASPGLAMLYRKDRYAD